MGPAPSRGARASAAPSVADVAATPPLVFLFAKAAGRYTGRKPALTPAQVAELRARVAAGEPKTTLARDYGVTPQTIYNTLSS